MPFRRVAQEVTATNRNLRRSFYVNELLPGGQDVQQARTRKEIATKIMNDASFEFHK